MAKRILVADDGNNRFVILETPDMTFVSAFGDGTPPNRQWTVGCAGLGSYLFGSYGFGSSPNIVSKWTLDGTYVSKVGLDSGSIRFAYAKNELGTQPFYIVPSPDRSEIYVSDLLSSTIKSFNAATLEETRIIGRYDANFNGSFLYSQGLAVYGNEAYSLDSNREQIVIFDPIDDFNLLGGFPLLYSSLFGGAMCCDSTHVYVHSRAVGAQPVGLYKFDRVNRTYVGSIPLTGSSYAGVAVDDTYVYVLDGGPYTKISKYLKSDLSLVSELPVYYDGRDLAIVWGLAVDATYIYAPDYNNGRIVRIDKSTMQYHSEVSIGGQHGWPQGIAMDSTYIYVMSVGATIKIAKYDKATITLQGVSAQDFSWIGSPIYNLALDASDPDGSYLYFCGQNDGQVWVMDKSTLTVVYSSGAEGSTPGERNIDEVTYFDFTPDGTKMVVSFYNFNTFTSSLKVLQTSDWTQLGSIFNTTNGSNYGVPLVCISNTQIVMFNDWDYQLEIRNISDWSLAGSVVISIANGFPTDYPVLGGIAYDSENNKFYVTDDSNNELWRLNGDTLAYEATSPASLSFPMQVSIYESAVASVITSSAQVIW